MPHTTTKNQRTKRVDTRPNEVILTRVILLPYPEFLMHYYLHRKYGES